LFLFCHEIKKGTKNNKRPAGNNPGRTTKNATLTYFWPKPQWPKPRVNSLGLHKKIEVVIEVADKKRPTPTPP
jgi:hypothetical protein